MKEIIIAIEIYFIAFVIAFLIACLIKGMQAVVRRISPKKEISDQGKSEVSV